MSFDTQKLNAALADPAVIALSDADAANQPGWSAPIITPTPYFVGHRKMLDVCCAIDPTNGIAAAEWVAGQLRARLPSTYGVYVTGTESDGSTGGLDVSNPATVAFIGFLVGAAPNDTPPASFTSAMGAAVIALGQTQTYVCGGPVLASDVTAARAAITFDAGYASCLAFVGVASRQVIDALNQRRANRLPPPTQTDVSAMLGAAQ